ncbi:hypothetical protein APF79_11850 [bacterium BRH_c32]|nr:MAG: hypothetical protein APF79_11850 [bacterium BRH_c32]
MKFFINITFLLFVGIKCFCQSYAGAEFNSMGYSSSQTCFTSFSLFSNPASLSENKIIQSGISYTPAPFGIKELSTFHAAINFSSDFGGVAVGYSDYGFDLYSEKKFLISYGRNIFNDFSIGASLIYNSLSISNYGNSGIISVNLGALYPISEKIKIGGSIENVTNTSYRQYNNQLDGSYWFGASYIFSDELKLSAALSKYYSQREAFRIGCEYYLLNYLPLRCGYISDPVSFTFGIGINQGILSVNYALLTHEVFELTHNLSISIDFD